MSPPSLGRAMLLLRHAFDLLIPPTCGACRGPRRGDAPALFCERCRASFGPWKGDPGLVGPPVQAFHAIGAFGGPLRDAVLSLKYRGKDYLGDALADAWLASWPSGEAAIDAVVPVPSSPLRLLRRGYNPADAIARGIARRLGAPVLTGVLARRSRSRAQATLGRAERQANASTAFGLRRPAQRGIARALLIDDVCTTGATLRACAAILLDAGLKSVWAGAAAHEA